ncbi:helix-turn-helix domain-containing protein [Halobacteriales archaeon QS_1_67_19]|nr:MAG: helix-turn-helix domain-containing protein [Halobacteriales archaeon QS_1_67_19]
MTLISDFYLETPVLQAALEAAPEMDLSVEQQTFRDAKPFAIALWASDGDFEAFEAGLAEDPTVTDAIVLAEIDDQRLYQVELSEEGEQQMSYHAWANLGGVFLSGERSGDGWHVRIRFPDRESLQEYVEYCADQGLSLDLRQLYDASEHRNGSYGLTDRQRHTLRIATEMGYFDIPRDVELKDLATELGVSRQAVSERLRRATGTLVRATVFSGGASADPPVDEE